MDSLASAAREQNAGIRVMTKLAAPIENSSEIAKTIFEAIADPIFVIDFDDNGLGQTFSYVNEAACRLLNRSRAELLTLRPGTVDELPDSVMDDSFARLLTIGRATFESRMIAADGTRIPVEIHASNARLEGKPVCIAVARSLVARKEMEDRTHEAREAAEAANRAKSEFLATMSHEIRTPLHGVIGFASLLDDADVPNRLREAIDGIRDSANLLLALVTDVLDFSRIEAGQLELQPAPLNLAALLKRIQSAFYLRAKEKRITFRYLEDPALPEWVRADSLRIEQVLGNLLGNALKFTSQGEITLAVTVSGGNPDTPRISFAVSDTGIGIRQEQLPRLFKPFSQADSSISRQHGGSGLGLVIVNRLCELMGGTVTVQSEFGRGSVFTASILAPRLKPAESAQEPPVEDAPTRPQPRLRILVAEDNATNRRLLSRMIDRLGYSAMIVRDGPEAIAAVARECFDLILMDISMPGISGLEATRVIRAHEKELARPATRIIALTAGVSEEERQACAKAGMDDFLGKPFTLEGLQAALRPPGRNSGGK